MSSHQQVASQQVAAHIVCICDSSRCWTLGLLNRGVWCACRSAARPICQLVESHPAQSSKGGYQCQSALASGHIQATQRRMQLLQTGQQCSKRPSQHRCCRILVRGRGQHDSSLSLVESALLNVWLVPPTAGGLDSYTEAEQAFDRLLRTENLDALVRSGCTLHASHVQCLL